MANKLQDGKNVLQFDLSTRLTVQGIDILMAQEVTDADAIKELAFLGRNLRIAYTTKICVPKEIFIVGHRLTYDDIKDLDCIDNIIICNYKGE